MNYLELKIVNMWITIIALVKEITVLRKKYSDTAWDLNKAEMKIKAQAEEQLELQARIKELEVQVRERDIQLSLNARTLKDVKEYLELTRLPTCSSTPESKLMLDVDANLYLTDDLLSKTEEVEIEVKEASMETSSEDSMGKTTITHIVKGWGRGVKRLFDIRA